LRSLCGARRAPLPSPPCQSTRYLHPLQTPSVAPPRLLVNVHILPGAGIGSSAPKCHLGLGRGRCDCTPVEQCCWLNCTVYKGSMLWVFADACRLLTAHRTTSRLLLAGRERRSPAIDALRSPKLAAGHGKPLGVAGNGPSRCTVECNRTVLW
jgi:hypothetical protein